MQERSRIRRGSRNIWRTSLFIFVNMIILLLMIIGSSALSYSDFAITGQPPNLQARPTANKTLTTIGGNRWTGDMQTTAPSFDFSPPGTQVMNVSPLFEDYYNNSGGAQSLGTPLTVAFPTDQGWIQFFESGALLMPSFEQKHTRDAGDPRSEDPLVGLIETGVKDLSTGIIRLPLFQALLTVGSQVPVGDASSPLTYVDLRKATNPDLMVSTAASSDALSAEVFVKEGVRAGKDVGHLIPMSLWSYINRPDISPDGWETDFGPPLTEALSFTVMKNGSVHQMLVQAFWSDGLVLDQNTLDTSGQPQIQLLESGVDYLRTLGPPAAVISAQLPTWVQGETALLDAPGIGQALAHVGQDFPLTLLGDTAWDKAMLWYHVQWAVPNRTASGWVQASAISFTSPDNAVGWAAVDALSPDLAAYLASLGGNVGAAIYDVTGNRYYTYDEDGQFITGSSIKVPIMLTLLNLTESQGREPDDNEMSLLTTMIENSNNDSAAALYYGETGGAAGVTSYLQSIGINGLNADPDAFGWSLITPQAMVNLLTLLYEGKILTTTDRALALNLMENIEPDQQIGVGDTAPSGATVAMKDGWVPGPDNLWAMNSSGIVTLGQQTYIIAVYSQEQASLGDGQAIAQHVCGTIASLLA